MSNDTARGRTQIIDSIKMFKSVFIIDFGTIMRSDVRVPIELTLNVKMQMTSYDKS